MTDLTPFLLAFFLGVVVAIGVGTIAEKIMNDACSGRRKTELQPKTGAVVPACNVIPDQRRGFRAPQAGVRNHPAERNIDQPPTQRGFRLAAWNRCTVCANRAKSTFVL